MKRVLLCSYYMPQPAVDSYSRRLFHLVGFLREAGWDVTCVSKNPQGVSSFARLLEDKGVRVHVGGVEEATRLAKADFHDVAILGFWHVAEPIVRALRACSPATRIVVDSGDVHFLRHARRILRESDGGLDMLDAEFAGEMVREINTYAAADAMLAVSRKEADLIGDLIGDPRRTFAVPDCEDLAPSQLPFDRRRGMFFVGNFEHLPNAEAVRWLCDEVLPHLDPALLEEHPIYVAGNAMTPAVRAIAADWPSVRMLGWVPSVVPYLERVRVSLIPLLHGAGTKRKMIQTLTIGTPTVTTPVGIEGFDVRDEEEVLVADDPATFASAITRLVRDRDLWERLAARGRDRIREEHSHEVARARLLEALAGARTRAARAVTANGAATRAARMSLRDYRDAVARTRELVREHAPPGATVLVVSKGDETLVDLEGRNGWHFPRAEDGGYAGFYPTNGGQAVAWLEAIRERGADHLVLPTSGFWWLSHYPEFRAHLESRYRVLVADRSSCAIFSLHEPPSEAQTLDTLTTADEPPATAEAAASVADVDTVRIPFAALADRRSVTRGDAVDAPEVSVVIPTRNRAAFLDRSLASLAAQTATDRCEVVVVDDGSTDATPEVCRRWAGRMQLAHVTLPPSGIALAKNAGVDVARAPIVLFFDDDDVADPRLVAEHAESHRRHPLEHVAVLGHTDWAADLHVTDLMRFITDVGRYLFGYGLVEHGQFLDHRWFWGGRSSCKKSLLVRSGGFRGEFTFGSEDIEAGHRISNMLMAERFARDRARGVSPAAARRHATGCGLTVLYNARARQHMIRPLTYDEFCRRCERQGRSQWQFSRFHADPEVAEWCGTVGVLGRWREVRDALPAQVERVHELEPRAAAATDPAARAALLDELHGLYWSTFEAFKAKGIVEAAEAESAATRPAETMPTPLVGAGRF